MENQEILSKEHQTNAELTSKINFYKDEIRILKNLLVDLSKEKHKAKELKELERLQNQLDIQENNANNISHAIRNNEKAIDKAFNQQKRVHLDQRQKQHHKEIELVQNFEKTMKELRQAVKSFSA